MSGVSEVSFVKDMLVEVDPEKKMFKNEVLEGGAPIEKLVEVELIQ